MQLHKYILQIENEIVKWTWKHVTVTIHDLYLNKNRNSVNHGYNYQNHTKLYDTLQANALNVKQQIYLFSKIVRVGESL